jgi:hypothetical protein
MQSSNPRRRNQVALVPSRRRARLAVVAVIVSLLGPALFAASPAASLVRAAAAAPKVRAISLMPPGESWMINRNGGNAGDQFWSTNVSFSVPKNYHVVLSSASNGTGMLAVGGRLTLQVKTGRQPVQTWTHNFASGKQFRTFGPANFNDSQSRGRLFYDKTAYSVTIRLFQGRDGQAYSGPILLVLLPNTKNPGTECFAGSVPLGSGDSNPIHLASGQISEFRFGNTLLTGNTVAVYATRANGSHSKLIGALLLKPIVTKHSTGTLKLPATIAYEPYTHYLDLHISGPDDSIGFSYWSNVCTGGMVLPPVPTSPDPPTTSLTLPPPAEGY